MDNLYNHSHLNYTDLVWFISECHTNLEVSSRRISLFVLYLLVFMGGLILNSLVVWVNWRRRNSRNGVLFCVLNVAISDLMVMIITPFFMLEVMMDSVWVWGHFLCRFTNLICVISFYSSSFFLAYMTVERYLAVVRTEPRPWGRAEQRKRAVLCGALWVISFSLGLLENVHVRVLEWDEPGCYIYPEHNFVNWFAALTFLFLILQFVVPASIIVTFNLLTLRAVRACPEARSRGGQSGLWLVHLYSLMFVLCWLPFHIVMLLLLVDDLDPRVLSCRVVEEIYFFYAVVQSLSLIHCVANPILYNFLSKTFRRKLVAAVAHHLPREAVAGGQAGNNSNSVEGGGKGGTRASKKANEMSDTSTSHSDVEP